MLRIIALGFALFCVGFGPLHLAGGAGSSSGGGTSTSTISFDGNGTALEDRIGQRTTDGRYIVANVGNTIKVGDIIYYRYGDHQ